MVNSRLEKFPLSPLLGERQSLLSHLPALTGQKTHREEGNLRENMNGKAFTLHYNSSEPFPVKSYTGKNGNEAIFQHMNCFVQERL